MKTVTVAKARAWKWTQIQMLVGFQQDFIYRTQDKTL